FRIHMNPRQIRAASEVDVNRVIVGTTFNIIEPCHGHLILYQLDNECTSLFYSLKLFKEFFDFHKMNFLSGAVFMPPHRLLWNPGTSLVMQRHLQVLELSVRKRMVQPIEFHQTKAFSCNKMSNHVRCNRVVRQVLPSSL